MANSTEKTSSDFFTIDPHYTKNFDDAFSIQPCSESHVQGCKVIGVHVTAAASQDQKVEAARIPCYYSRQSTFMDYERKKWTNLKKDNGEKQCISFYVHSSKPGDPAHDPILKPIPIGENYTYEDYPIDENNLLWKFFVVSNMKSKVFDDSTWCYLVRYPKSYRPRVLCDKAAEFYRSAVAGYLRRLKQPVPLIVRPKWAYVPTDVEGPMIAKQDVYQTLEATLKRAGAAYEEPACLFVASVKDLNETCPDHDKTAKFARLIVNTNALDASTIVFCTSPQTKLHDYVNQQILLRCMSGGERELLYSEADLQGIVAIRYNTPRATCASVKNIHESHFAVFLEELQSTGEDISRINFEKMGAEKVNTDQPTFAWKKDTYLDGSPNEKKVVTIDRKAYKEFYKCFRGGDVEGMKGAFEGLACTTLGPTFQYDRRTSNIQLTVQRGTSLRMQISLNPSEIKEGLGHRMLLVGRNCHICLAHLRSPEMTFRTDRRDLKSFLKKPECYKNGGVEVKVNIEWYGGYNAGGNFAADKKVEEGDLLCIRKEEEDYVWCAHAVVTKVSKEPAKWHVEFAVLTLMQVDEKKRQEEFIVEIIELREAAPAADAKNA